MYVLELLWEKHIKVSMTKGENYFSVTFAAIEGECDAKVVNSDKLAISLHFAVNK